MYTFKKQIYSEQVANYIKQCILDGDLVPGDKIKEVELANKLKISRAPIREALHILVREELLTSEPQKGKFIKKLNAKQIKDSYLTGGILEGAAVAQTAHLFNESDIMALENLVDKMKKTKAKGYDTLAALDNGFHEVLFSKSDNQILIDLSHRSCQRISKFLLYKQWRELFTPEEFYHRHLTILNTIKNETPWAIEMCIRQHYTEIGNRLSAFGGDSIKTIKE